MSGGSKPDMPPEPSPEPTPIPGREMEQAKSKVKRRRGRASTVLAGQFNSNHGKILLGE